MSNDDQQLLDMMSENPLFEPEYIVDNFRCFSDQELEKQLTSYRDYR